MKLCWLDLRAAHDARDALLEEALHQRVDGVLADDPAPLARPAPAVGKIRFPRGRPLPEDFGEATIVLVEPSRHGHPAELASRHPTVQFGQFVEVVDAATLEQACQAARTERWVLLEFADPTKIPLEIVLAAAAGGAPGNSIITVAGDVEEAKIIFGVLEHGSDGGLRAPPAVGDATRLSAAAAAPPADLDLADLPVPATTHPRI